MIIIIKIGKGVIIIWLVNTLMSIIYGMKMSSHQDLKSYSIVLQHSIVWFRVVKNNLIVTLTQIVGTPSSMIFVLQDDHNTIL